VAIYYIFEQTPARDKPAADPAQPPDGSPGSSGG